MVDGLKQKFSSTGIPTKVVGSGSHETIVPDMSVDQLYGAILRENDGICMADSEHLIKLFQEIAKNLETMKANGLTHVFLEIDDTHQDEIDKFMRTGEIPFDQNGFPLIRNDVEDNIVQTGICIPKSFFDQCRKHGLKIIAHDTNADADMAKLELKDMFMANDENSRRIGFANRVNEVGLEQAEKDKEAIYAMRHHHNDQWIENFKETMEGVEQGKFLIIGGSAHFMNLGALYKNIPEITAETPDIDERIAALGYSAPLVNAELARTNEAYSFMHSSNLYNQDTPDYEVRYPKSDQQTVPKVKWIEDYIDLQFQNGRLSLERYHSTKQSMPRDHFDLKSSINGAIHWLNGIDQDLLNTLPDDHPLKSEKSIALNAEAITELKNIAKLLNTDHPDYDEIGEQCDRVSRALNIHYDGGRALLDYSLQDHLSNKEQGRYYDLGFDMSTALEGLEGLPTTLSVYARHAKDYARELIHKEHLDQYGISFKGMKANFETLESCFVLPDSEIFKTLKEDHPFRTKENIELAEQGMAHIDALRDSLYSSPPDLNQVRVELLEIDDILENQYGGGFDALLENGGMDEQWVTEGNHTLYNHLVNSNVFKPFLENLDAEIKPKVEQAPQGQSSSPEVNLNIAP